MLQTRIITKIKHSTIYTNRMKSNDSINQIKNSNRDSENGYTVSISNSFIFNEIRFSRTIDSITFEINFLVERIKGRFRTAVPVKRNLMVTGNSLYDGLCRGLGKRSEERRVGKERR